MWLSVERQPGKHRAATDAISDAAADVDDYYHHPLQDGDAVYDDDVNDLLEMQIATDVANISVLFFPRRC